MTGFDLRIAAERLRRAALEAVDPARAVRRFARVRDGRLELAGRSFELARFSKVWLLGAGKAAVAMASAVAELTGERLSGGLVVTKDGHVDRPLPAKVRVLEAGHPVPDARSLAAGRAIQALLDAVGPDDLVLLVLSGGGSALITLPVDGITLGELQATTDALLRSGATIDELNGVRKHLDVLKGGGVARLARGATLVTLALSDVPRDDPSVIASGPSIADPSTFAEACDLVERHGLRDRLPSSVVARLERGRAGAVPETPKPGEPLFETGAYVVVGSNRTAAEAALNAAHELGFHSLLLTTSLAGEAREVGKVVAALGREVRAYGRPVGRPGCLVLGGETTVTVQGDGKGGRNQELVLAAALALDGVRDVLVSAFGTDGTDGPTDAAGAVVTGDTIARARALGLDASHFLAENDAYRFFAALGDLVMTGPTGTNVCDLVLVLVG
jgi:hydroxypyruvate reductase